MENRTPSVRTKNKKNKLHLWERPMLMRKNRGKFDTMRSGLCALSVF